MYLYCFTQLDYDDDELCLDWDVNLKEIIIYNENKNKKMYLIFKFDCKRFWEFKIDKILKQMSRMH